MCKGSFAHRALATSCKIADCFAIKTVLVLTPNIKARGTMALNTKFTVAITAPQTLTLTWQTLKRSTPRGLAPRLPPQRSVTL